MFRLTMLQTEHFPPVMCAVVPAFSTRYYERAKKLLVSALIVFVTCIVEFVHRF